ncbi:MAG TPA: hypothetical protein VFT72_18240 [Opitutaceae bacterium]|nr:hypothetical protein [Opitutaceae bacterium]
MNSTAASYFEYLRRSSLDLIASLGLRSEPLPLEAIMRDIKPKMDDIKAHLPAFSAQSKPQHPADLERKAGVGLNSVGMLVDRLTILFIREWCLLNKGKPNPEKARTIYEQQTKDIIVAIAEARPGSSALNTKITNLKGEANAKNWVEAFYGLLTTNILLWESQEILYIRDIGQLPAEELRSYIQWFAYGNMRRNEYIQLCEELYWRDAA